MQGQESTTFRNTIILIVGLFVVWELAYLVVGDVALRSPWQTIQFLGKLMQTDLFWLHLAEFAESLCGRARDRGCTRAPHRFCPGAASFVR